MELIDKQPSWKIMDNKGRVTVVLHWDQQNAPHHASSSSTRDGRDKEAFWRVEVMSHDKHDTADTGTSTAANVDVTNVPRTKLTLEGLGPRPTSRMLPEGKGVRVTSPEHDHSLCDFHCSALHEKGAQIHVNKSVATSPIQEVPPDTNASAAAITPTITKKGAGKGHVRFSDVPEEAKIQDESESDTENTANEEEQLSERYLLLVDQLSLEQNRHLSVKDLGIILERLSSKIVDVDRLERERESTDVHNWTIKATIRGEVLREIGVIYNGQYYGIMEHPGYF